MVKFTIADFQLTKEKLLNWVNQFSTFCFLDNHQYQITPHSMECLLGAGIKREIKCQAGDALQRFQQFIGEQSSSAIGTQEMVGQSEGTWLFGHLGYDLKNEIEKGESLHPDKIGFPDLYFFEPEIIIRLNASEIQIDAADPGAIFKAINAALPSGRSTVSSPPAIKHRIPKENYLNIIEKLKQHILRGDCYEINFCQEFFSEGAIIDPLETYKKLSSLSPNPFSSLYRIDDQWLICASPERFLRKEANKILSQPIKGTAKRIEGNESNDQYVKNSLARSAKDRSENVMVVDLVRNDLAKVCEEGTVSVDELYGVYTFPQVHQMISTVSGTLKKDCSFMEIIRATFPMGSMTGAPKKRVMELIEKYESTKRGIFSGAMGYITPAGDFDFNVVIRSILYNAGIAYLSFQAGSAITFYSVPEKEWEECMLKAEAIRRVLGAPQ